MTLTEFKMSGHDKCCCEYSKLEISDINGGIISVKNPDNAGCNCNYCKLLVEREKLIDVSRDSIALKERCCSLFQEIHIMNKRINELSEVKPKVFCPYCGSLGNKIESDLEDYDCRIKCAMCHSVSYASLDL